MQLNLNNIQDLDATLRNFIKMLSNEFEEIFEENGTTDHMSASHLFSSQLGISFVSEAFKQQTYYRFSLCRMLLTFLHILIQRRSYDLISEYITSDYIPQIIKFTKSYFIIYWFSKQCALPVLPL